MQPCLMMRRHHDGCEESAETAEEHTSKPVILGRWRLRGNTNSEMGRLWTQLVVIVSLAALCMIFIASFLWEEKMWRVPFRLFEDTFGVDFSDAVLLRSPALMNRDRYEKARSVTDVSSQVHVAVHIGPEPSSHGVRCRFVRCLRTKKRESQWRSPRAWKNREIGFVKHLKKNSEDGC